MAAKKRSLGYILSDVSTKLGLNEYIDKILKLVKSKLDIGLNKIQEFLKDQNLMDDSEVEDRNRIILLTLGAFTTILIGVLLVIRLIYNIIYNRFIHVHQHRHKFHTHHHHKHAHGSKNVNAFKKEN